MKFFVVACCACLVWACTIPLTPPETGGVGGARTTTVDWNAICIARESHKASVSNVSVQTGYSVSSVATSICSQKYVISCYKSGKCK